MGGASSCIYRQSVPAALVEAAAAVEAAPLGGPSFADGAAETTPAKEREAASEAPRVPSIAFSQRELYERGLDETPKSMLNSKFRYYCPLCMRYFRGMLESQCCGHYCCYGCARQLIERYESQRPRPRQDGTAEGSSAKPAREPCRCPGCNGPELSLAPVADDAPVRSYEDDEGVVYHSLDSPVRIGDSYETLRRKMLAYEETGSKHANVRQLFFEEPQHAAAAPAPAPSADERAEASPTSVARYVDAAERLYPEVVYNLGGGVETDCPISTRPGASTPRRVIFDRDDAHLHEANPHAHDRDQFVRSFVSNVLTVV